MPHVVIEYSADIDDSADLHGLCAAILEGLAAHPAASNRAALKVRAAPSVYWVQGTEPQSFAHAQLLLLPGRDAATKTELQQIILDCMAAALPAVGSLSVDVGELSPTYLKRVL